MSAALQGLNDAYLRQDLAQAAIEDVPRKGPRREGTNLFQIDIGRAVLAEGQERVTKDIEELKTAYVWSDTGIDQFISQHRTISGILRDAIRPLKAAFGQDRVFRLEISIDEDDSKMLYGVALWSDSVRAAAQALDQFAEDWWLDHMTPNTTDLAFIYRISR